MESLLLLTVGLCVANWRYQWSESQPGVAGKKEQPPQIYRAGFPWRYCEMQYEAGSQTPVLER